MNFTEQQKLQIETISALDYIFAMSSHNDLLQCVGNNNFFYHYKQKLNPENLFVNLRNAATSWGTESKQYKEIQKMVQDLLREMQDAGEKTNLSGLKQKQLQEADDLSAAFEKLDLQLKDQEAAERMEE
ncbi:hypothetical protein D6D10_01945 [Aureobasidium pullulans]|nr:hypothetical protein D6D10_01945 [Aureobasidium pullulans]